MVPIEVLRTATSSPAPAFEAAGAASDFPLVVFAAVAAEASPLTAKSPPMIRSPRYAKRRIFLLRNVAGIQPWTVRAYGTCPGRSRHGPASAWLASHCGVSCLLYTSPSP